MELTPVKSSHIATIDYIASHRVLLVGYRDGSLYAFERVTPQAHASLIASESKGAFLHQWRDMGSLITKGEDTHAGDPVTPGGGNAAPMTTTVDLASVEQNSKGGAGGEVTAAPLNVLDEDADKCCKMSLRRSLSDPYVQKAPRLICSECGTEFRPEMAGELRYWRIVPAFGIVRPK